MIVEILVSFAFDFSVLFFYVNDSHFLKKGLQQQSKLLKISEEISEVLKGDIEMESYLEKAQECAEKTEIATNEYINAQAEIRQNFHDQLEKFKSFKVSFYFFDFKQ